jgi:hypothetical protein
MPGLLFKEASSVASIVPKKFPKHQSSIELKFQKRNRAIETQKSLQGRVVTPTQVLNSLIRLGLRLRQETATSVGRDKTASIASLPIHSSRECLVARDQTLLHT